MALFSICVSGWEEYSPIWFSKDCSVDEFREFVRKCVVDACNLLVKENDNFIDGHNVLDKVIVMMKENGFSVVRPESQIDLRGSCIYYDHESEPEDRDKPEIMDEETWKIVVKHNEKYRDDLHREK